MNLYNFHDNPSSLDSHANAHEHVPELVWGKYAWDEVELRKRAALWARDGEFAYFYAKDIIKDQFQAGEAAIAKKTYYAFQYALRVLSGPFPAGEKAIAKDSMYAYDYALYVLKGPFPAGEKAIAKDSMYAYWYAEDVLKGPFPAGEKAILASQYRDAYLKLLEKES